MSTNPQSTPVVVGMVMYPRFTQLDLTGPYEVFSSTPEVEVHLLSSSLEPVRTEWGLEIVPTTQYAEAPRLDVLFVPGGPGSPDAMEDERVLAFLKEKASEARYVTSVCTGALVLGAAGLLRGYRAATHWATMDILPALGAEPVKERVVVDRNRVTGGGVTAGIDFALLIVAEIFGEETAKEVQLSIEYDPKPPFDSGSPEAAGSDIVEKAFPTRTAEAARRAASRLGLAAP
jgi:cyclohexyl-isocyanide hydratase